MPPLLPLLATTVLLSVESIKYIYVIKSYSYCHEVLQYKYLISNRKKVLRKEARRDLMRLDFKLIFAY